MDTHVDTHVAAGATQPFSRKNLSFSWWFGQSLSPPSGGSITSSTASPEPTMGSPCGGGNPHTRQPCMTSLSARGQAWTSASPGPGGSGPRQAKAWAGAPAAVRRACCALACPLRGHHVSSPSFTPPSPQLSNPASHPVILPTTYFLLPGRVQKTGSVASGDTGCRAAGIPPSRGGCLPPRTPAGSAASTSPEHGAGTLQAAMDQTSPPTEVKTNEEMRQARRRGGKTPASSHETEAMASFGSCRLPEPQRGLSPTPPPLCWTGRTHVCPGATQAGLPSPRGLPTLSQVGWLEC